MYQILQTLPATQLSTENYSSLSSFGDEVVFDESDDNVDEDEEEEESENEIEKEQDDEEVDESNDEIDE